MYVKLDLFKTFILLLLYAGCVIYKLTVQKHKIQYSGR